MSKSFFRLLSMLLVGVGFAACSLNLPSDYTPRLGAANFLSYNGAKVDTLSAIVVDGVYRLDTIALGDTVSFMALMDSYTNSLVSFTMQADTTLLHYVFITDSIQRALDNSSRPEEGVLYFKSGYNGAAFPIVYVPQKTGTPKVTLTVESDSKFPTQTLTFVQPVQ